jgi:Uma2 family endonuclease
MKTMLKLGPRDHGKLVDYDEFMAAEYLPGYRYEIIDGRVYVSTEPPLPENRIDQWIFLKLAFYSLRNRHVINYVTTKGRVVVPGRPGVTVPAPDITAYRDFPLASSLNDVDWEDVSPILVAEVLVGDEPEKDMVRNVELYLLVPTIREYWLFDARQDADHPTLTVRRKRGNSWVVREYVFGDTDTTRLLPGFTLLVDPSK